MTSSINLAALGFGGMDTSSLVTSLVSLESQPMTQLQTQEQNVQSASSTISSFASTLSSLSSSVTALSDPTSFEGMGVTSSDPSIVGTASGSPAPGQWTVSVSSIAQPQRTLGNGTSDSTSALGISGTLNLTIGSGSPTAVQISSTDSLSDIADEINSSGARVQASVLYDGSQYHLLVSGLDSGSSNSISFDESGLTSSSGFDLGLSDPSSTIQQATSAQLTVGGVAITSDTNQVTDAIPGVTLAITQPTNSPATVTIASDPTSLETNIQSFVTAYNAMVQNGQAAAGYGSTAASNTLLQGDPAVNTSLDELSQLIAEEVPGSTGAYTTLASVGITLNDDGTLSFAQDTFAAALQADPTSVERLFVTDPTNGSTGVMGQIASTISSLTDPTTGVVQAEITGFQQQEADMNTKIADMQTQITAYQTQLQTEFTQMNTQLEQYKQISQSLNDDSNASSSSSSSTSTVL